MKSNFYFINFFFPKRHWLIFLSILAPISASANLPAEDSIRKLIRSSDNSCSKSALLIKLSEHYSLTNGDSALFYSSEAIIQAERCGENKKIANAFLCQSNAFDMSGNYPQAVSSALKALKIFESLGDDKSVALILHRLGKITFHQSESCSNQLRNGYHLDALKYYRKALAIEKKLNDLLGITDNSIEIGRTLFETGDSDSALLLLNEALATSEKLKEKKGFLHNIAKSSYNISLIFIKREDIKQALYYMTKAAEVDSILNNKEGVAVIRMAEMYYKLGELDRSVLLARKSIDTAQKYGYGLRVLQACEVLYQVYYSKKDFENAYYYLLLHRNLSDSLNNEEHVKEITKMEMTHDFEKKEAQEKIKNEAEKKQQRLIIYGVLAVLVFLTVFLIYGIITFRQKQKAAKVIAEQKKEVERQKMMVEEKNKEVHDSIVYAKRIQSAILPPKDKFNRLFTDAFVLYKPKDIVAGDFYFLEQIDDEIILAVADCTGHGVPGAMVSVVCHNALKRSIREFGLHAPGEILDKAREMVIEEFSTKNKPDEVTDPVEDSIKDGMDIAICNLHLKNKKMQFAGANNPVWILRDGEIHEIKGDKQPVGSFSSMKNFSTQYFELKNDDIIYLFSDGFVDQFGGERSKKFKSSSLKNLILKMTNKKLELQKQEIDQAFEAWRNWPAAEGGIQGLEQVDDVCILGIRV